MFDMGEGPAWSVVTSSQISLNFAMYVKCAYGLIEKENYTGKAVLWPYKTLSLDDEAKKEDLKKDWNVWWEMLVQAREKELLHGQTTVKTSFFDPPDFAGMENEEIKALCQRAWPAFFEWWTMPAGGQFAVAYWEQFSNLHLYIRQYEEEVGRKVKPFKLNIDLVYTGLSETIDRSRQYSIMTMRPEPFMDAEWWKAKLKEIG